MATLTGRPAPGRRWRPAVAALAVVVGCAALGACGGTNRYGSFPHPGENGSAEHTTPGSTAPPNMGHS